MVDFRAASWPPIPAKHKVAERTGEHRQVHHAFQYSETQGPSVLTKLRNEMKHPFSRGVETWQVILLSSTTVNVPFLPHKCFFLQHTLGLLRGSRSLVMRGRSEMTPTIIHCLLSCSQYFLGPNPKEWFITGWASY